jgi:hypothetical protein
MPKIEINKNNKYLKSIMIPEEEEREDNNLSRKVSKKGHKLYTIPSQGYNEDEDLSIDAGKFGKRKGS